MRVPSASEIVILPLHPTLRVRPGAAASNIAMGGVRP
jgi:hypothetical protein